MIEVLLVNLNILLKLNYNRSIISKFKYFIKTKL
jgi:hypothetical protein